jgi:hypothetical protein
MIMRIFGAQSRTSVDVLAGRLFVDLETH